MLSALLSGDTNLRYTKGLSRRESNKNSDVQLGGEAYVRFSLRTHFAGELRRAEGPSRDL